MIDVQAFEAASGAASGPCRRSRSAGSSSCRPSEGLELSPWPMSSGKMRKYLVMSSGWPGPKRTLEKIGLNSECALAAGAVQQQHGVVDVAGGVAVRRAECEVVELELGQRLAGAELEIVRDVESSLTGHCDCGRCLRGLVDIVCAEAMVANAERARRGCAHVAAPVDALAEKQIPFGDDNKRSPQRRKRSGSALVSRCEFFSRE